MSQSPSPDDRRANGTTGRSFPIGRTVAFALLGLALLFLALRSVRLDYLTRAFASAPPSLAIAALLSYAGSYACRALRFRLLLYTTRPAWRELAGVVSVHNLLNMLMPMRTGELSYVLLAHRRFGAGLGEAAASLVLARVYDVLGIAVFFVAALLSHRTAGAGDRAALFWMGAGLISLSLLALVAMAPAVRLFHRSSAAAARAVGVESRAVVRSTLERIERFSSHFERIRKRRTAPLVFAVTELQWFLTFVTCYALLRAAGIGFPFDASVLGSTGLSVALILPINTFANAGTFEAGWVVGYALAGLDRRDAAASAVLAHVFILAFAVVLALVGRFCLLGPGGGTRPARGRDACG